MNDMNDMDDNLIIVIDLLIDSLGDGFFTH